MWSGLLAWLDLDVFGELGTKIGYLDLVEAGSGESSGRVSGVRKGVRLEKLGGKLRVQ